MLAARPRVRTKGFIILTLTFKQDQKRWLAECSELGTATYGRTLNQAHEELVELVTLHLDTLEEVGERERFFAQHRIEFYADDGAPTQVTPTVPVNEALYFHTHRFPVVALV
jgi:hypothetical protein